MGQVTLPEKWNDWVIDEALGSGSFGTVYSAYRETGDEEEEAAIKILEVPASEAEHQVLQREYPDEESLEQYYLDMVDNLLAEIHTMETLKDHPNIVHLQDYAVERTEKFKWRVYIRMELLQTFEDYSLWTIMDEKEVLRLGIEISSALEECAKAGIIHRDIKPENIMITEEGTYKLGDFGIARMLSTSTATMSLKGTFSYMAPEVYKGQRYNSLADMYSLGLVLYRLLNNNRDPFVDPEKQMIYYKDREAALEKRMEGKDLPCPVNASETMGNVLKRACAFHAEERFKDISELKNILMKMQNGEEVVIEFISSTKVDEENASSKVFTGKRIIISSMLALGLIGGGIIYRQLSTSELEKIALANEESGLYIEENGSRVDNCFEASNRDTEYIDALNTSDEAQELLPLMLESNEKDRSKDYGNEEAYLIYQDGEFYAGEVVNYQVLNDSHLNVSDVQTEFNRYYFKKDADGTWEPVSEDELSPNFLIDMVKPYIPESCFDAMIAGRNCSLYSDGLFWQSENAIFKDAIKMNAASIWQNEDGSVDVQLVCRNGMDTTQSLTNYWLWFADEAESSTDVLLTYGEMNDSISIDAGSTIEEIAHFEVDSIQNSEDSWEYLVREYCSAYDSNFRYSDRNA